MIKSITKMIDLIISGAGVSGSGTQDALTHDERDMRDGFSVPRKGQLVETTLIANAVNLLLTAIREQKQLGATMSRCGNLEWARNELSSLKRS
jgi:hypothetical protein